MPDHAPLDPRDRVYPQGHEDDPAYEQVCQWFAKCARPANGLRPHPVYEQVPICARCDDKLTRLSAR